MSSYDQARNDQELGEGFPLYKVIGDLNINENVQTGDIIAPAIGGIDGLTDLLDGKNTKGLQKPGTLWLVIVIAVIVAYMIWRKFGKGYFGILGQ